ncbi:MAG: hypothetical protein IMW89_01010 [Ktedonobacteraceae bacterium]|nr:hypothetical protein [Ktedonobacteraceae bacterium]
MPQKKSLAEKIIANISGLRNHLQSNERPITAIPAIWDSGQSRRSIPCDVILTNQRLLGYYFVRFPRERLFLEELALPAITAVTLRQKKFEPVFRELMVGTGQRRVYIRAPRQKIEILYTALREALNEHAPQAVSATTTGEEERIMPAQDRPAQAAAAFGRQELQRPFETSPLAIMLLFSGGLLLEIAGLIFWLGFHTASIGTPLFIAGLVAVIAALLNQRRRG